MPVTIEEQKKGKLRIKDLAFYMENNYENLTLDELYEVIMILGRLEQRTALAKQLVTFLQRRNDQIVEEVRNCDHSARCPFNPHELIIVYLLRLICNKSCTKALTIICTKILIRLGYTMYSDVTRYKYKVYRMNIGKDGSLHKYADAIDYVFSDVEDQSSDHDDFASFHSNDNLTTNDNHVEKNDSDECKDDLLCQHPSDFQLQCMKYVSQYMDDLDIRRMIREEIHQAFVTDVIPLIKKLLPTNLDVPDKTVHSYNSNSQYCTPNDDKPYPHCSNPSSLLFNDAMYTPTFSANSLNLTHTDTHKPTTLDVLSQSGVDDNSLVCSQGDTDKPYLGSSNEPSSFSYFPGI